MIVKYIKGLVRYDGELEKGLFEITINGNYSLERDVKDVKAVVRKTNIKGLEVSSDYNFRFKKCFMIMKKLMKK